MKDQNNENAVLNIDDFRKVFLKNTRKAFQMLPMMNRPYILDLGCGTGVPTIELAELSDGSIIAMDINSKDLTILQKKIKKQGLDNRITVINRSLLNHGFLPSTFDIIWAEGVLHIVGFKKGFKACHNLLKKDGFLVINERIGGIQEYINNISSYGFTLYDYYELHDKVWWTEFYRPLEDKINKLTKMNDLNKELKKKITRYKKEIKMVKVNPSKFNAAFYLLQKI